jgi:uncharacterized membrane protein YfcA
MLISDWAILGAGGFFSGILAGLLGIGGGTFLVPLLLAIGYSYAQSVATSSAAIVMTSISGTFQNWRMGYFKLDRILLLGIPGVISAQLGVSLVGGAPKYILELGFAFLLMLNIYLTNLRNKLIQKQLKSEESQELILSQNNNNLTAILGQIGTGIGAGMLSGLFGVGGGVIIVPLQILLLGEKIKVAIQSSLGVIVLTSISACLGHAKTGNVLWLQGFILGMGGLVGAQISTRYLPKLPDHVVRFCFNTLLVILSIYFLVRAKHSYQ